MRAPRTIMTAAERRARADALRAIARHEHVRAVDLARSIGIPLRIAETAARGVRR